MRSLGDSTTAGDIPATFDLVAGYVDGRFAWSPADWSLFAAKIKVRIAVLASTNDGHVLDVETGDATPDQAPGWISMRRAAGTDPTVYCNLSNVDAITAACGAAKIAPPHFWLAHYDNVPQIPTGYVAKQYANQALTGGHWDASVVADYWPGVDPVPVPAPTPPPLFAQSDDIAIAVGAVGMVSAGWSYRQLDGTFTEKYVIRKVDSRTPGRHVYTIRPQVDPDSDPTEWLDGPDAIFVVTVTNLPGA